MSFLEWLEKEHGMSWEEILRKMSFLTITQYSFEYEFYCYSKGIEPKWHD